MRHRTKTLQQGKWFTLTQSTNPKTERKVFTIRVDMWKLPLETTKAIRDHFDPGGNRGTYTAWKYKDRKVAEQLLTMAILKWGA